MQEEVYFCLSIAQLHFKLVHSLVVGVKVGLHDAVFYGFPYKLRPKPKIATCMHEMESLGLEAELVREER